MVTQWSAADVASCRVVPINQYVTFSFRTQFERPPICLHQQSRTPTVKHRHSILPRKVLFVHQEPDPSTKESPASDSNGIFLSLFSSSSSSPSSPLSWSSSFYSFLFPKRLKSERHIFESLNDVTPAGRISPHIEIQNRFLSLSPLFLFFFYFYTLIFFLVFLYVFLFVFFSWILDVLSISDEFPYCFRKKKSISEVNWSAVYWENEQQQKGWNWWVSDAITHPTMGNIDITLALNHMLLITIS